MVRKTIRIKLDELTNVSIYCRNCNVKIQYDLEKPFKVTRCPVCEAEHENSYYVGLIKLQEAFRDIPRENKGLIEFEIEIND